MGFLMKTMLVSLIVLAAVYGIWWIFVKYSLLTIGTFTFIVISLFVISGLAIALMKANSNGGGA